MTRQKREAEAKSQVIRVRDYCGTYIAIGGGMRASNSRGPQNAAHGLALKLFAGRNFNLVAMAEPNPTENRTRHLVAGTVPPVVQPPNPNL